MRVLVTGHQGYIGTVLTPMLLNAGHEVVGLDNELFVDGTLGPPPVEVPNMRMDVRDIASADLHGFDAVIHLAGISNDPLGDLNPNITLEINHLASVQLAKAAKAAGIKRFLFASSCSLYGASSPDDVLDESAAFNPVTPYGRSKILVEQDLARIADHRFSPTYLRCATAYGFSPRLRADLVVNNLTGYALLTGEVLLKSDGRSWRPLVHVEDICRAYLCLLDAPRQDVHNEAFNVGRTTENYQVRDIATMVKNIVPNSTVQFADGASADTRCYRVDCTKLERSIPGYEPTWTVERGIQQLYDEYKRHGLTADDFLGPQFLRIKRVLQAIEANTLDRSLRRTYVATPHHLTSTDNGSNSINRNSTTQ